MSWTVAAKVAAHTAIITKLATGSGTATLKVYAGATLLVTVDIDHSASSVASGTGVLTLVPTAAAAIAASGTADKGVLTGRDGTVLEDNLPVQAGSSPVPGYVVLSSLALVQGGAFTLVAATVG